MVQWRGLQAVWNSRHHRSIFLIRAGKQSPFSHHLASRFWSTTSTSSLSIQQAPGNSFSWDETASLFLEESSREPASSTVFRQAQSIIDLLVPPTEEEEVQDSSSDGPSHQTLSTRNREQSPAKNISLAFDFLDRLLELEHQSILSDENGSGMSNNNQCLNAVLYLWRDSKGSNTLSSDQVLEKLDNYRSIHSSLWIPDVQTYNILLDGAAIRGQVEFCQRLYKWMWEESKQDSLLRPDIVTLRTMFKAWIQKSRQKHSVGDEAGDEIPNACEALVQDWKERNRSTKGIYKSLIHAWAHVNPLQSEVYLKYMAQGYLEGRDDEGPDTVAWNRVISAYAIVHDQPYKASQLLREFWQYTNALEAFKSNENIICKTVTAQPDLFSYNSVLEGWARRGNAKEANKTLTRLQTASSTSPNIISYTSAIKANGSDWRRVKELALECIQELGQDEHNEPTLARKEASPKHLGLDHQFFHTWLQAAIQAGGGSVAVSRALKILEQMKSLQIEPDPASYLALLNCFIQDDDDIEGATKWFMENGKSISEPSVVAWITKVLTMVDDISIVPPWISFTKHKSISLLQAVFEQDLLTQPESLEKLILKLNGSQSVAILHWVSRGLSSKAYSLILRNLAKEKNGEDAESVFYQWKNKHMNTADEESNSKFLADAYASLIIAWSKSGNVKRCEYWLKEWVESDIFLPPPNQRVNTAILSAYGQAGDAHGAQAYLNKINHSKDAQQKPDAVMYNIVLNAWVKFGSSQQAQQYFDNEMKIRDTFSYNTLINAKVRKGNLDLARDYIERLVDLHQKDKSDRCQPDLATFRPLLVGICRRQEADAAEQIEEILVWMNELYEKRILRESPDLHCYQLVLDSWAKSKAPDAARRAEEILRNMPLADASNYSSVMKAYKRNPGRKQALLHEMYGAFLQGNRRMKPSVENFSLVLEDLARMKSPKNAESFLRRMKKMHQQGLNTAKPNRKAFNLVLKSWARSKDPKAGKRTEALLREMQSQYLKDCDPSLQPSVETYKSVLTALSKQKNIAKVESLFDELFGAYCASKQDSLKPDAVCVDSLFLAYRSTNNVSRAREFLSQLEEWKDSNVLDTNLKTSSYNMVLACMASKGLGEESEHFLRHMESRGVKPDVLSYNTAMKAWARTRLPEAGSRVESIVNQMKVTPDHMAYSIWLRAVVKSSNTNKKAKEAAMIVDKMKSKGFEPNSRDLKLLAVALGES
jgi:pentatricopeptide repeat protein